MHYILTIWLIWADGDSKIIQIHPFEYVRECIEYAHNFERVVTADGVVASKWTCEPNEEMEV